ncbi:MAG: alpha/beta hydrolase [Anaerolineaceae bacterium]
MQTTISTDGTNIAFDRIGQGPTLILITGALNYSRFGVVGDLVPLLLSDFTVINYDRRGRGCSSNNLPYSVEKEIEDINALINTAEGPAYLYGHSAGAALALFAAAELGENVKAVAAYEPPMSDNWWNDLPTKIGIARFRRMLAKGQKLELITQFMRFVGMSTDLIEETLASEHREVLIDMAPTLVYEAEILLHTKYFLKHQAHCVTQPALLLAGDKSFKTAIKVQEVFAQALPKAQTKVLQGQTHSVEALVLAPILKSFFSEAQHQKETWGSPPPTAH